MVYAELNLRPMLRYHVRFVITPKPADVEENFKPSTSPYRQEIPRGVEIIPCRGT